MKKSLSKAEWAVMSAIWQNPNQTMSGIIETMDNQMDWKYNTYVSYVGRLCEKGFVGYNRLGRDNFYYPLVEKEQCFMEESRDLINRFGSFSSKDLLVYMIRDSDLSAQDRDELKKLLDDLNKEGDKK